MKVTQVYSIINSVVKQMNGTTAVAVTDLRGLISLGNQVLDSDVTKDKFLNTLVDRIGKTVISSRPYSPNVLALLKDAFTFGAILQKIYVEPIEAQQSPQWDLTNGANVDQYIIKKPEAKQKLFADVNTWEVQVTIPDFQLRSAFTSEAEMGAFIDAVFSAFRNSMEVQLEAMTKLAYCNFIGERVVHTKVNGGATVIDLLAGYNAATGSTLTAAKAFSNPEFLRYCTTQVNLYIKRMTVLSTLFNSEEYKRHTPTEYSRVTMLSDFAAACVSYMQSTTYHDELVALPNYTDVAYWQGSGTAWDTANASKVTIKTASGYNVEVNGVVCLITDIEAMGVTIMNRRSKSAYNARGEYTNYFDKADIGYFNDLSENGIVFVVADTIAVPTVVE